MDQNNIYKCPTCRILVNGALTELIKIYNGIRQGCPLSMMLFGVVMDAFIQSVLLNSRIAGISFGNFTKLILQLCADDVTFYFTDKKSVDLFVIELIKFKKVSGLEINCDKTELIIHGIDLLRSIVPTPFQSKLKTKLTILGIVYSFCEKTDENWITVIKQIEKKILIHEQRHLSLYGKIQIINTILLPVAFQKTCCLHYNYKFCNRINHMVFKFLWSSHSAELIDRNIIIADLDKGGIRMPDFHCKFKAATLYKLKEIANEIDTNKMWVKVAYYNIGTVLRCINRDLYNNSEPHKDTPNSYWEFIKDVLLEMLN